jgi:serine protease Do
MIVRLRSACFAVAIATTLLVGVAASEGEAIRFWGEEPADSAPAETTPGAAEAPPAERTTGSDLVAGLPNFADLAEALRPSVVNISTSTAPPPPMPPRGRGGGQPPHGFGGPGDPYQEFWEPFERFFGPMPRQGPQRSLGSGFILNREGLILTNNHVVEDADEIVVQLDDEREYKAQLIGRDPKTDIAVIKIEAENHLQPVTLGNSDDLRVGDWIFAIGNPFGLQHTVTAGIVSAKSRFIGQGSYDDFIQTDAAINPGNSGGPLVNLRGEVVGINSAIFSRSGGNIGIGFAIPINLAKELLPQLREKGKVVRGWLGVYIQKVTPEIAESLGLTQSDGALVADVMTGTPAQEAGVEVGDVIVEFDGQPIKNSNDLPTIVARTPVGKATSLRIIRGDKQQTLSVTIGELSDSDAQLAAGPTAELGLTVQKLTPEIAESLGIDASTKGVVVAGVDPNSPAEEAQLQRGDVILEVNRKPIEDENGFSSAVRQATNTKTVLLLVRRGENTIFMAIKKPTPGKSDE